MTTEKQQQQQSSFMRYASAWERRVNILNLEQVLKKKATDFRKTWHLISTLMRPRRENLSLLKASTKLAQREPGSNSTLIYIHRSED